MKGDERKGDDRRRQETRQDQLMHGAGLRRPLPYALPDNTVITDGGAVITKNNKGKERKGEESKEEESKGDEVKETK
jgi:hypothetical protein